MMSDNKLMASPPTNGDLIAFDKDKVALIRRMIAKNATPDELELFLHQCKRTGLDPLAKQLYFVKYGDNVAYITSIDGYRLVADRTGRYAGNDEAVFEGKITAKRYDKEFKAPAKAKVTVWKIVADQRVPFSASAYWTEYFPDSDKKSSMWESFPRTMLAKCAEAKALRKAFPADLSGIYTRSEMEQSQIGMPTVEGEIVSSSNGNKPELVSSPPNIAPSGLTEQEQAVYEKGAGAFFPLVLSMEGTRYTRTEDIMTVMNRLGYQSISNGDLGVKQLNAICEYMTMRNNKVPGPDAITLILDPPELPIEVMMTVKSGSVSLAEVLKNA